MPYDPNDPLADYRQKRANRALLDALASPSMLGILHKVQQALDEGADANVRATTVDHGVGFRPLHIAARNGASREAVALLIKHGAKVGTALKNGETPLHVAARHGHTEAADALLDGGAALDARTKAGHTPLGTALTQGGRQMAMVEHLMAKGASLAELAGSEPHPLHLAARNLDLTTVTFLMDHGVSPNVRDNHGSIPLGSMRGSRALDFFDERSVALATQIVDRLVTAGADVNVEVTPHSGETALSYLFQLSRIPLPILHRLMDAGSSPYGQPGPTDGSNAPVSFSLFRIAARGDHETLKALLDRGVNAGHADKFGQSLLHHTLDTSRASNIENVKRTLELLIEHGADVNARTATASNKTPLSTALLNDRPDIALMATTVLLEHGANANLLAGPRELSPLVIAALPKEANETKGWHDPTDRLPLVEVLLQHRADPLTSLLNHVPLMFDPNVKATIVERLKQQFRDDAMDPIHLALGVVSALLNADPSTALRLADEILPMAFDLKVEPEAILRMFNARKARGETRLDTVEALDLTVVPKLEARMLTLEIDRTTGGDLHHRERARL